MYTNGSLGGNTMSVLLSGCISIINFQNPRVDLNSKFADGLNHFGISILAILLDVYEQYRKLNLCGNRQYALCWGCGKEKNLTHNPRSFD